MSTYLAHDMMFEDVCDGINFDNLDDISVGSLDVLDETLADFSMQTYTTAPACAFSFPFATEQPHQTAAKEPRMVSMEDISSIREIAVRKEDKLTPYDSLRLLAKRKQQGVKRSTECHTVVVSNKQTQPAPKHRKVADPSLLHRACSSRNLSLEIVQGILREDPWAASRQHTLFSEGEVYNYLSHHFEIKKVRESYTYPLHMALEQKGVDATVIKALIDADKAILSSKDGLAQEGSLHILLKHHQNSANIVDAILVANPSSVMVEDRHFNTPLHVACRSGASEDVIRRLWSVYPGALAKRNFQGLTPLDVARTNGHMCSDGATYFLWQKVKEAHRAV